VALREAWFGCVWPPIGQSHGAPALVNDWHGGPLTIGASGLWIAARWVYGFSRLQSTMTELAVVAIGRFVIPAIPLMAAAVVLPLWDAVGKKGRQKSAKPRPRTIFPFVRHRAHIRRIAGSRRTQTPGCTFSCFGEGLTALLWSSFGFCRSRRFFRSARFQQVLPAASEGCLVLSDLSASNISATTAGCWQG
jgi:hypothetical protein